MKIGYSFWGFLAPFEKNTHVNTPDGSRGDRLCFVNELIAQGHEVIRLQKMREDEPYPGTVVDDTGFPDVDIVYCEWRWPTWKNTGENPSEPDYNRQIQFLNYYHSKGVPIVILDSDFKLTYEDELRWPNAILADPCVKTRLLSRPRLSISWCFSMDRFRPASVDSYNYVYVGNNYGRDECFDKYYGVPSQGLREAGIQTMIHGNWLQKSPERKDPSHVVSKYPTVSFGPRLSYRDIFSALNSAIAVTHISTAEYMAHGNITCRFYETLMSEVPALIPEEYVHVRSMGLGNKLIVKSSQDVVEKVKWIFTLSQREKKELVDAQEFALRTIVDPNPAKKIELLESIAKGIRP